MTKDQIQQLKKEIVIATEAAVKTTVNGKLDRMNAKFDSYVEDDLKWKGTVVTFMTEMTPVKDGLRTVQSINKFIKWLGFPAIGAVVAYWIMK